MKLTKASVLPAAGIALLIGLIGWAWIGTARHHTNPAHMRYAVEQMHTEMQDGTMPMSAMRMDDMEDIASMHEAMVGNGSSMTQMPMTATQMNHMRSMGMGLMSVGAGGRSGAAHGIHHGTER